VGRVLFDGPGRGPGLQGKAARRERIGAEERL